MSGSPAMLRAKSGALPAGKPAVSALPGLPRTSRQMCSHVWGQIGISMRVDTCMQYRQLSCFCTNEVMTITCAFLALPKVPCQSARKCWVCLGEQQKRKLRACPLSMAHVPKLPLERAQAYLHARLGTHLTPRAYRIHIID